MSLFIKTKKENESDIVNRIQKLPGSRKPDVYKYFYDFMLELNSGGFSLVDIGGFSKMSKSRC